MVSCIPAVASWHDSDTVRRLPAAVAAAVVVAVAAVAAVAVVAETVACTAPLSAPCWNTTTHSISDVFKKNRDWVHHSVLPGTRYYKLAKRKSQGPN